jgi:hypothetical protein
MDDFSTTNLNECRNEWISRLINILTPLIHNGFRSILNESITLCKSNNEQDKYLMTLQNFLSRIPKWNPSIVETETERIISESNINYLNDLITCVHIVQLKIMSSMRVGQKQKLININIPKLNDFIHKIYINSARKLYTNIFLFERINISPLDIQKNNREIELIIREEIMNTIRENIPVEDLLKSYLDESVEEEIVQEVMDQKVETIETPEPVENKKDTEETANNENNKKQNDISIPTEIPNENKEQTLKFDNVDKTLTGFNEVEDIIAPKDVTTLETISNERNEQRKNEALMEEEEAKIKIMDPVDLKLDDITNLDLNIMSNNLNSINNDPINLDIQVLG